MAAPNGQSHELAELKRLYTPRQCRRPKDLTVACSVFPHYNATALNDELYEKGWSEHVIRRGAAVWFPGHRQPRTPALGEQDEADPSVMAQQIDLAADHGMNAFIFDWYWYGQRPALHECLEQGFLRAPNRGRLKFAIMWCPSHWHRFPLECDGDGTPRWTRLCDHPRTADDICRSLTYVISRYFHEPNYWRIDGKGVIIIYEFEALLAALGPENVRGFLDTMRDLARSLGHEGVHFNGCSTCRRPDGFAAWGFDSFGESASIALQSRDSAAAQPTVSYAKCALDVARSYWPRKAAACPLPYFPNVATGWDTTPRFVPPPSWPPPANWPGLPIVVDESPEIFEALVRAGIARVNAQPDGHPKVLTVACWNEWTEGHYLLPDTVHGMGMLDALARALEDHS